MSDLLKEFEKEFEKTKKELKFKASLKGLDDIFFLKDFITKEGYVSDRLSRQVARRIVELYVSWAQYLHGIIIVNPGSLTNVVESQAFSEEEKGEMNKLFDKIMIISTEHNIVGLTKDRKREAAFFDDAVSLWKESSPQLTKVMKKVSQRWIERSKAKPEKEDQEFRRIYG